MAVRLCLIVLAAGLHGLAMPPADLDALGWVALVPFLLALRGVGPGRGALLGLVFGTLAIWSVGWWVPGAIAVYYQQPAWFGFLFALVASVVFAGTYSAGFAACTCWLAPRVSPLARLALVPATWVAWELARARLLTGEPWLLYGYALLPRPLLIQAADVGGVYLLSFLLVLANTAVAETLADPRRASSLLGAAAAAVLAFALYGGARLAMPLPTTPEIPVAIVQGNNDLGMQWRSDFYGQGLETYLRMSASAARRRPGTLLVWPEASVTFFLERERQYRAAIGRTLAATNSDLIAGGPHSDGEPDAERYYNSAFYVGADGRVGSRYDKTHLLPFAEYFPLRTIEFLRRRFERVRFFTPGDDSILLDTRIGKVAVAICFEGIFPDLVRGRMARGAVLLVNLSNDAWLGRRGGPEQHLAMVAMRAVENRTWVVRATTSGISTVIDPWGRIGPRTPLFEATTLDAHVVPLGVTTLYERLGDAFAWGCVALSAAAALAWGWRPPRAA